MKVKGKGSKWSEGKGFEGSRRHGAELPDFLAEMLHSTARPKRLSVFHLAPGTLGPLDPFALLEPLNPRHLEPLNPGQ